MSFALYPTTGIGRLFLAPKLNDVEDQDAVLTLTTCFIFPLLVGWWKEMLLCTVVVSTFSESLMLLSPRGYWCEGRTKDDATGMEFQNVSAEMINILLLRFFGQLSFCGVFIFLHSRRLHIFPQLRIWWTDMRSIVDDSSWYAIDGKSIFRWGRLWSVGFDILAKICSSFHFNSWTFH